MGEVHGMSSTNRGAIIQGDCLHVLPTLEAESVDSIVTDPPYGLSFMGRDWDHGVPGAHFWEATLRVAKPGAHLLAFGGTRTFHRLACAIENAGWDIRDCISWLYGSGFPKSHNGEWGGTALKPAWEPVIVARKPLVGTVAANFQRYGVGGINVDACRIGVDPSVDDPRLGGIGTWSSEKMAKNVYEGGYAGDRVGSSPLGRWPANLCHDGSDEVVRLFPESESTGGGGLKKSGVASGEIYGNFGPRDCPPDVGLGDSGSAARFFYCAKASKEDREDGLKRAARNVNDGRATSIDNAYQRGDTLRQNTHPTVKPTDLMRWLCRLVTPKNGLVLDPFCGSGSTGKAAVAEGFRFIGIELNPEYVEIATARIAHERAKGVQGVLV